MQDGRCRLINRADLLVRLILRQSLWSRKMGRLIAGKNMKEERREGKWGSLFRDVDLESWFNVVTTGSLFLGQETEIVKKKFHLKDLKADYLLNWWERKKVGATQTLWRSQTGWISTPHLYWPPWCGAGVQTPRSQSCQGFHNITNITFNLLWPHLVMK